jgi:hypothetical protein
MNALAEYFNRTDTPEAGSPVGCAISLLVERVPQITPEEARVLVQESAYPGCKKFAATYQSKG